MDEVEPLKTCKTCGLDKERDQFSASHMYRDKLRPSCRKCRSKTECDRRKTDPSITHRQRLRQYGITSEQFMALVDSQMGKCGNYSCPNPGTFIDHDHNTGKVRSLLCPGCNTALGMLQEQPARILGLAEYVHRHA